MPRPDHPTDGGVDGAVARVYVVPFIGAACVVLGFEHGDWGPACGGHGWCSLTNRTFRN
jgi:hypothetical protein